MLNSLLSTLAAEKSIAITALLGGNLAQAYALWKTWKWHRQDRQTETERWIDEVSENTRQLSALTEAITQLRLMVAGCSANGSNGRSRR